MSAVIDPAELTIEPMTAADLDDIDLIERTSFNNPWPRDTFVAELSRPHARVDVARRRGAIVGFCNYWLVARECHVLAIAVHADHRHLGIGNQLMLHMFERARDASCTLSTLEVRRGNEAAQRLYQRHGYAITYVRAAYYSDGEDALVMTATIA